MSQTRVGVGMRRAGEASRTGATIVRQSPQAFEYARIPLRPVERRADPALRVGLRRQRMPRPEADQRSRSCASSRAWLTGATIARSFASGDGGGAAPISEGKATPSSRRSITHPTLPLVGLRNWHLRDRGSRGAAIPHHRLQGRISMLRSIDHFIGGSSFASAKRAAATCSTPTRARSRRRSARHRRRPAEGGRCRQGRPAGLGRDQPAAPRPRHVQVQGAGRSAHGRARASCCRSEHGKVIADAKGDVQRGLEVIEYACGIPQALKGEYTRRRRPRHRRLFDAPAARHRRGHHAVQLPGDDPDVDVRNGDRLRQRLHPEALRARPDACRSASPS